MAARRTGAWAVAAAAIVAVPFYLYVGRTQSFFFDEWDFLSSRDLSSGHDLLQRHNEHWSTVPIVVYRVLWLAFGLHTYVPYQLCAVVLHVTVGVLLWVVMRRAAVHPFVAAAASILFLLLGSGRQDILWGFQIGFDGALVCGLAHLLLADHDGPVDRRDAFGFAFGVVGLMCSGVAVTMVAIVGLAMLLRRGWRVALLHTVPLAALFVAWWVPFGAGDASFSFDVLRFVRTGASNAFVQMGQIWGLGLVLATLCVVGLLLVGDLRRAATPVAMLVGGFVFLAISGSGRADATWQGIPIGPEYARASRYVHIFAALALPAIAVAADAIARHWRYALPAVVVVLLAGVPGNVLDARPHDDELGGTRAVVTIAFSPELREMPRSRNPLGPAYPGLTVGWIITEKRGGRISR